MNWPAPKCWLLLFLYLSINLFIYLYTSIIFFSVWISVSPTFWLPIYLFVCLSASLPPSLCICLSISWSLSRCCTVMPRQLRGRGERVMRVWRGLMSVVMMCCPRAHVADCTAFLCACSSRVGVFSDRVFTVIIFLMLIWDKEGSFYLLFIHFFNVFFFIYCC